MYSCICAYLQSFVMLFCVSVMTQVHGNLSEISVNEKNVILVLRDTKYYCYWFNLIYHHGLHISIVISNQFSCFCLQ